LDTNLKENTEEDRKLTKYLYYGHSEFRIAQEIVLGIGGTKILSDLGYKGIQKYHLNEGHGSFLILELLSDTKLHTHDEKKQIRDRYDFEGVKSKIIFTTHTPVAAGHDIFPVKQVKKIIGDNVEEELLDYVKKGNKINMTHIALDNSYYINGVAKKHAEITMKMFPEHHINSITNGIHSLTWVHPKMREVFDSYIENWFVDPSSLRFAKLIPKEELWSAHQHAKKDLIKYVNRKNNVKLSSKIFTIGFARRATPYKRVDLLFKNLTALKSVHKNVGKIQIILAGKAHPHDEEGKELIKKIFKIIKELKEIKVVYLEDYNMSIAQKLIAGVDLWLNTPQRPKEASGTSGMKAAHNGVPQLSTLDGWWIEGCLEGITGWAIGDKKSKTDDTKEAQDIYHKLGKYIVPMYYYNRNMWIEVMRNSIAFNASYFNTHRMVKEYVIHAYFE